jgi:MFS family permease
MWEEDSPRQGLLTPYLLLKTMLYDPLRRLNAQTLYASFTIDTEKHHDFFVVTVSRLCYYCGMSVQTFFLYFVHDIIKVHKDAESAVAYLAILAQLSGTFTTYPIGLISDRLGGRRKPFVYLACFILGGLTLSMVFATTMHQMIIISLIMGSANGIYLTMDTSLAVDTLPKEHEEGGGGNAQLLGSEYSRLFEMARQFPCGRRMFLCTHFFHDSLVLFF